MISSPHLPDFFLPAGFQFGALTAGIKQSGKPDLAIAVADAPASAAAVFTSNRVVAAPLIVDQRHLTRSERRVRVIAANSGNANCATGDDGIRACEQTCTAIARVFECPAQEVFPSSTGIIGVPFPTQKIIDALPRAKASIGRSSGHFDQFAHAILTTDTRRKVSARQVRTAEGKQVRIVGTCKGAGMIYPRLVPHATMLAFIFTDAAIAPAHLQSLLDGAVEHSFNRISVDGDTSTNDTVLLLASGASGAVIDRNDDSAFREGLAAVCTELARLIVGDGEGISHVVELQIAGAPNDQEALQVARAIAHSPLVKTAWAGSDPNWGRILAAIGYSGVPIDPGKVSIWFGDQEICVAGQLAAQYNESEAHKYLTQREFVVRIDLGLGHGSCRFWTSDLTAEYVRINADYST